MYIIKILETAQYHNKINTIMIPPHSLLKLNLFMVNPIISLNSIKINLNLMINNPNLILTSLNKIIKITNNKVKHIAELIM